MKNQVRSPFRLRARHYKIENKAEEATVYIYDEIGWFGVSAEQFVKDLNAITSPTIHLHLNTPGGAVFDGTAIYNAIKQHTSRVITHIDGLAASIASVIALAGDEVRMSENAFFMIHEPWSIVIGMADDMRHEADLLDKVGGTIAKVYADKTGKTPDEIADFMAAETWFTASEALEAGFIDQIDTAGDEKAKAGLFDLSVFANVPDVLKSSASKEPTARDLERILRDAGYSKSRAVAIAARVFSDELRDVVTDPEPVNGNTVRRDTVPEPTPKRDRVTDLLIRAERAAPTKERRIAA